MFKQIYFVRTPQKSSKISVVSNDWETIDPTPDLHALFIQFNETFFWGQLLRSVAGLNTLID